MRSLEDVKEDMVDCIFKHIDCMNDYDTPEEANSILQDYLNSMNALVYEYLDVKFPKLSRKNHEEDRSNS